VRARSLSTLPLPAIATYLELSRDGRRAVAALRAAESVAVIPLPEALRNPALITVLQTPGIVPGQVEVADDGRHALVFSTAEPLRDDRRARSTACPRSRSSTCCRSGSARSA
jgi:hypothetical protein